ncbi:MAG: CpXC domain-containing protein [Desulfurococcales archaeon]|nr:CpXC domain-containing protein [Desulfurococcales archaeon]
MARKKNPFICPRCGTKVPEPTKTWTLVSPIPDKKGRITVTVMGSFTCPNCGYSWRAVVSKIKTGGEEVESEEGPREPGQIIEIDLSELDDVE